MKKQKQIKRLRARMERIEAAVFDDGCPAWSRDERRAAARAQNVVLTAENADLEATCQKQRQHVADLLNAIESNGKIGSAIIQKLQARVAELEGGAKVESFQSRCQPWLLECFGAEIAADKTERNHRFLEETLELVQSLGCTQSEALQLVDYVYSRPVGDPPQECGGVMVTLAALCLANSLDVHECGEIELARVWTKVEQIRAKQAAKPRNSPLPEAPATTRPDQLTTIRLEREKAERERDTALTELHAAQGEIARLKGAVKALGGDIKSESASEPDCGNLPEIPGIGSVAAEIDPLAASRRLCQCGQPILWIGDRW